MPRLWARAYFAATALLVVTGTVIQQVVVGSVAGGPGGPAIRTINVASYFSIESDLLVGAAGVLLALDPRRSAVAFRVFRLAGLVAVVVTSVVYHALFGDLVHFTGWALAGDQILHTLVPALAVTGWLWFGPRGLASWRIAAWSMLYPLAWLTLTGIRGALTGWYPYPFIDPGRLGYATALRNVLLLSVLVASIATLVTVTDHQLTDRSAARAKDRAKRKPYQ